MPRPSIYLPNRKVSTANSYPDMNQATSSFVIQLSDNTHKRFLKIMATQDQPTSQSSILKIFPIRYVQISNTTNKKNITEIDNHLTYLKRIIEKSAFLIV